MNMVFYSDFTFHFIKNKIIKYLKYFQNWNSALIKFSAYDMQEKVIRSFFHKSTWDGRIRTFVITGPKPGALPLGDAPFQLFS